MTDVTHVPSTVRPIPTRYAGCHFRSRLEARWAVFLDTLGVAWEYEPQGFDWPAGPRDDSTYGQIEMVGGKYLPDFWLPSIDTWFEVKGATPTDEECRLHWEFSIVTGQRHITAYGPIPRPHELDDYTASESMQVDGGSDFHYLWCVCGHCGKPGIAFDGRGDRVCRHPGHGDKGYTYEDPRILNAYDAARSARFEHGESGAT